MSGPTSVGDLLDLATDHIDAAARAPAPDPQVFASAWPQILRNGRRALQALEAAGDRTATTRAVRRLLAIPAADSASDASTRPDPDLQRTGQLLGAAADLLAGAPRPLLPEREAAARRIAGVLAAAATLTAHATIYDPRSLDTTLSATVTAREAHQVIAADPQGRVDGVLDDATTTSRPVAAPADLAAQLDVAVHGWRSAAIAAAKRADVSGDDLRATALTATQLLALAQTLVRAEPAGRDASDQWAAVDRAITTAGQHWTAAARFWRPISTGTPASGALVTAARSVRLSVDALARKDDRWLNGPEVVQRSPLLRSMAAARRALSTAADVAQTHTDAVQRLGRSEHLYIPATLVRPDTPERLRARLRREWVPLTRDEFPLFNARTGAGYDPALATSTRTAAVAVAFAAHLGPKGVPHTQSLGAGARPANVGAVDHSQGHGQRRLKLRPLQP